MRKGKALRYLLTMAFTSPPLLGELGMHVRQGTLKLSLSERPGGHDSTVTALLKDITRYKIVSKPKLAC